MVVGGAFQCFADRAACGDRCFDVESPRWSCFQVADISATPRQPAHWSVCMMCRATEAECKERRDFIRSGETDKVRLNMSPCVARAGL